MEDDIDYNTKLPGAPYDDNIYCPIIYAFNIFGQKWKLPIMWILSSDQTVRYNELKRKVTGITHMMLTKSLKELEEYKLITRIQYDVVPLRVEYSLTRRGEDLLSALNELYKWGEDQIRIDKI